MEPLKNAFVTGGGTGIGLAVVKELLNRGYSVTAAGMDCDDEFPTDAQFVELDVCCESSINEIAKRFDCMSAVVNAAGIILHDEAEFTAAGFRKVVDVNLTGGHLVTLAFRDALRAQGGAVVNVASMWSFFGSARNPAYASSKGAIVQLTRSHAVAFASENIRVNAVAPGWIETRLAAGALNNPERSSMIMARLPMKRWGQPKDVAHAVAFLVSEEASYITGVVLPIDGGYGIS